jgi:hypothetical protein
MLSTPQKRFVWARSERLSELTFFRTLIKRRRKPSRRFDLKERTASGKWKPAPWTPWLWIK